MDDAQAQLNKVRPTDNRGVSVAFSAMSAPSGKP
jgi:hypothetical protein